MAIPDKPLEVTIDPDELTLDEVALFEPSGFTVTGFMQFLAEHTNWTREEIGKIKVREMKEVADQLGEKIKAESVPLVS